LERVSELKRRPTKDSPAKAKTLDRHAEEFLRHLEAEKNASPQTIRTCRTSLEAFRKFRPSGSWTELRADDFRAWMLDMMNAEMARSSVRLRFAAMRAFYAFLQSLLTTAEQLTNPQRWERILLRIFEKFISSKNLHALLPTPATG
jgi:site-specific recombinase XerD